MKAYYLNIKQFNLVYNYINKTDQLVTAQHFDNANNIGDVINIDHTDKKLIYCGLMCVDSLLNTKIYTFTHFKRKEPQIKILDSITVKQSKPKIKLLVKLIKYLTHSFPSYSNEFFMYHLYSKSGVSKYLTAQDLVIIKSQLSKVKSIEIHSIQQNSNITIKNINVNNGYMHHKTTSNTRDSSHFNKILTKLNSNNVSVDNSIKSQNKLVRKYLIPSKLNFNNPVNNVYVVARDNQIRYKTEEDSEDSLVKQIGDISFNTPKKKKIVRYYS
jgi:hypothetical protein